MLENIDKILNEAEDGIRLSEYRLVDLELGATALQVDVQIAVAKHCPAQISSETS